MAKINLSREESYISSLFDHAQSQVRAFATSESFASGVAAAFGASPGAVASAIKQFDRKGWPKLVALDDDTLGGARAAYERSSDTIFISRELLEKGSAAAITSALVEEIGHALDARVNAHDAPGDEGAIFAQFVQGQTPSASDLAALKADHDQGTISVDGQTRAVEFAGEVYGSITLDGSLADWTVADQIDQTLSVSGYDIYARAVGASYVFAIQAPVAIGANTTAWLNTDRTAATGYQIWGWAGGAEYNINFDATATPRLYTGADGQTPVAGATVAFGYSANQTIVEFAVDGSALGGVSSAINTLWDINDTQFLPTAYSATQYTVAGGSTPPPAVIGSMITLDGSLADWTVADQIDTTLSVAGYDIYGKSAGAYYVFALVAPAAIGANTTAWLNTDKNAATGYQIWGWAGGAEYNINFDAVGTPHLYTGADGASGGTLVAGANVAFGYSADHTIVEFAIQRSAIGSSAAINTLWDVNNSTFLSTQYGTTQYAVSVPVIGSVTLDGTLAEWTAADAIDKTLSVPGYDIYARVTDDSYVFALSAPVAIGANTTAWLNTDQNAATGYQIFGTGGAEYNINFDSAGVPRLYTGAAGETLVAGVPITYAYSADAKVVEFALQKSAVGAPMVLNTLWDVNDSTFLPDPYGTTQYEVLTPPPRTDLTQKVGIVYSETSANQYFNKTVYSQLFMAAQNQAMMAGVPFDILTESDLTNLSKLANYDALLFPGFQNVKAADASAIESTLRLLTQNYNVSLITAGNFMTNSETGVALPGDSYARMKSLLGVQFVTADFPSNVTVQAGDVTHPMMQDYTAGEAIRSYTNVGWLAFAPVTTAGTSVLATQTVGGQTYNAIISTNSGGDRNIHFSTDAVMADNNLLWQAIDYAVDGSGVSVGLQLSRHASIVATRVDMDQAMELFDVNPADGSAGIYDVLLPILQQWKTDHNFVGSYYVDIGDNPALDQGTDWAVSRPYYSQLLALGNELGSHSTSHPAFTDQLTAEQLLYEFQGSKQILDQQMSPFVVDGAAVPGAPESLATALAISQYYNYLSGGFSSIGAGYPGAFGFITPEMATADKVYLAPNLKFDFSLVEFGGMTPTQAAAEWQSEWNALTTHSDVPVLLWPWHDYGAAAWATNPPAASPYTTAMFTDFISQAKGREAEFVTLDDLAERISAYENATVLSSASGNTVTATVTSPDAGKFTLDLDNLGTQTIASVSNWYAYDADSVFLPRNGGTYTITLGAAPLDVTHITSLPMRADLISLTGNGSNLSFSLFGEGRMEIDLANPAGKEVVVTGATVVSLIGDQLTLDVGPNGQHDNVSVTLNVINQPPTITSNGGGATAAISLAENSLPVTTVTATDPDGPVTYLIDPVSGGADAAKFTINQTNGALTFVAAPDFEVPTDQGANNVYDVIVTARDGQGAIDTQAIAVTVSNVAGTLTGTASADTLTGTSEDDTISGLGGNDTLIATVDNVRDTLDGGAGTDTANYAAYAAALTVNLASAAPIIVGGSGSTVANSDVLVGIENFTAGSGNDTITGTGAANILLGGAGNDTLIATVDNVRDTLDGGAGTDTANYAAYAAALTVNLASSAPIIVGGSGSTVANSDVLVGIENFTAGSGNDTITGTGAANILLGGAGNDTLIATVDNVRDTLDGSAGTNTANYAAYTAALTVNLASAAPIIVSGSGSTVANSDVLVGIENFTAGSGNDTITGTGAANILLGGAGNDTLIATVDNVRDTLDGGAGTDTANYAAYTAALTVNLASAAPIIVSGSGSTVANSDVLVGIENFTAGSGNDTIIGTGAANILLGGNGDDILAGGAGADQLTGGAGRDRYDFNVINEGLDTIIGFTRGATTGAGTGEFLDIKDVLVGYTAGTSNINSFVRLTGTTNVTVQVNADGVGTDFVSLATLTAVANSTTLLNELVTNGNLIVS